MSVALVGLEMGADSRSGKIGINFLAIGVAFRLCYEMRPVGRSWMEREKSHPIAGFYCGRCIQSGAPGRAQRHGGAIFIGSLYYGNLTARYPDGF